MTQVEFLAWANLPADCFQMTDPWEPVPYTEGRECVALALMKGTEIHFAISPEHRHRVIQRARAREFLRPLFERHGFLTTRVEPENTRAKRFIERLGFTFTWSDGVIDHYMLTALPFERN